MGILHFIVLSHLYIQIHIPVCSVLFWKLLQTLSYIKAGIMELTIAMLGKSGYAVGSQFSWIKDDF